MRIRADTDGGAVDKPRLRSLNDETKDLQLKSMGASTGRRGDSMVEMASTKVWLKHLPNKLTLARIGAIPLLLLLYPFSDALHGLCAVIFAAAAVTDWLDGFVARRYGGVTALGALLDQVADKMLMASTLVLLASSDAMPPFMAALLISRDIAVNGIRLLALERQQKIHVSDFGKWKTTVLSVAVFCLFINHRLFDLPLREIGMVLAWIGLALSLYSGWSYGLGFLRILKKKPAPVTLTEV